jgi:hypothetical protein
MFGGRSSLWGYGRRSMRRNQSRRRREKQNYVKGENKKLPPESDPSSKEVKSDPKGLSPERCGS